LIGGRFASICKHRERGGKPPSSAYLAHPTLHESGNLHLLFHFLGDVQRIKHGSAEKKKFDHKMFEMKFEIISSTRLSQHTKRK